MTTSNTFQGGLVMDTHELAVPNNVLTNCLNGTLITYNGNELILQNDVGNTKLEKVKLSDGFIPVGLKEFNGVFYIFSVNPSKIKDGKYLSEIGTFPSPDYSQLSGNLIWEYQPLHNLVKNEELTKFTSYELNFDTTHPITIECRKSYDSSVDLIFTDNKNLPRLVNSRFSVYGDNKYSIIDRDSDKDTNLYKEENLTYSISLNRIVNSIVGINFIGVNENGNLPIGTYTFYFSLADADDNESDIIGQSSNVVCHKGKLLDPYSIDGGLENENSHKTVTFKLTNIPELFNRVYVYYSRATSDLNGVLTYDYKKIFLYFPVNNSEALFTITGYEATENNSNINNRFTFPTTAKAQSIVNNILFYGNTTEYLGKEVELRNLCLTEPKSIFDSLTDGFKVTTVTQSIGYVSTDSYSINYRPNAKYQGEYYNTLNIYHYIGYWPDEYYRLGIVFIYEDYSLSPVFNIKTEIDGKYNDYGIIQIKSNLYPITASESYAIGLNIEIGSNTLLTLKEKYRIKGCFIVRQKRLKNILCLGVVIGYDKKNTHLPLLKADMPSIYDYSKLENLYFTLSFTRANLVYAISSLANIIINKGKLNKSTIAGQVANYYLRQTPKTLSKFHETKTVFYTSLGATYISEGLIKAYEGDTECSNEALICPEYEINLALYNLLFTSSKFYVLKINKLFMPSYNYDLAKLGTERKHFYTLFENYDKGPWVEAYLQGVPENTGAVKCKNNYYCSRIGNEAEANIFKVPFTDKHILTDIRSHSKFDHIELSDLLEYSPTVRGIWGPYVGIELENPTQYDTYDVINIKLANNDMLTLYRDNHSEYYPISPRIELQNNITCFNGDCFVCNFTHRMNRNFTDPSFPINDEIADSRTNLKGFVYKTELELGEGLPGNGSGDDVTRLFRYHNYDVNMNPEFLVNLNRSDVNAVQLGHWFTCKLLSSYNLSLRSTDPTQITERATTHTSRTFYPLNNMATTATYKMPDSYLFNEGYSSTVGAKIYNLQNEVPAVESNFDNKIIYSGISNEDNYVNLLRVFEVGHQRTMPRQYGSIVKLLNISDSYLLCVFEHALALLPVNEQAIAAQSLTGYTYITTKNVLGDTLKFLSTEFGSKWADSVIQTPTGVYGIDTVAKKIWHYGTQFECISDLHVLKFLRDNLTISEYNVDIKNCNIKTHYNSHKLDIMFTFYYDCYAWNLCYNEITKKWTTFYSWLPIYSDNINNTYYSFTLDNEYLWEHNKEDNWCNWYGELHPFEFEFVVADKPQVLKIFNNMLMIANSAEPESFHFEIIGDSYDFSRDKLNMYYRQEKTKEFFNNLSNIHFDSKYKNTLLNLNVKSTLFPLKVSKILKINKMYDLYQRMTSNYLDYLAHTGSEIIHNYDKYGIATHVKARPLDSFEWTKVARIDDSEAKIILKYYTSKGIETRINGEYLEKKVVFGRRLGNCIYEEDLWKILIPAIEYVEKNESKWITPPININTNPIPEDVTLEQIEREIGKYKEEDFDLSYWSSIKLTRIRDKYIKIKVRYSGKELAIISAIITSYKESYS